ncbi:MAG: hypothetical protein Q8N23_25720 [Archangium sp.]|nr:hypothetical protein [Archangium sp.]MDP3156099.1 hypothetical protein [Archangium sp.]MDP3571437.1 hypothetical protein [Archangium sp.]
MRALLLVLVATTALATPRPARDTADVGNRGSYSVGIFNPLRIAFHNRFELQANPLLFFVAPHLDARFAILKPPVAEGQLPMGVRLTAEAGLLMPTFGMRLMKGFFFPTWATSPNDIGFMLIPRVGLLASGDFFTNDVLTVRIDGALRIPLGPNNATPMNSFLAPLEILFAAPLTGFCGRLGGAYDHAFGDRLRLRGEVNLYVTGQQGNLEVEGQNLGPVAAISPFIFTAHLGLDIAVFQYSRITVGALFANYDQGATQVTTRADGFSERTRVRSNNILPTLDFIWAGF